MSKKNEIQTRHVLVEKLNIKFVKILCTEERLIQDQHGWWYDNLMNSFKVRDFYNHGDSRLTNYKYNDDSDFERKFKPRDFYQVMCGINEGSLIMKSHCKVVK